MANALAERRVHAIKSWFYDGKSQQEVVILIKDWPLPPKERDALILQAIYEMEADRTADEDQNRQFVMDELKAVYYRACSGERPDLGAQVAALAKIGTFCGLSEKNPYRGKLVDEKRFTDEDYERALQS